MPSAENRVFDLERREDAEGEPPTRSILGLERMEHSPRRIAAPAFRNNGEPPTRSLLGLEGIEPVAFRLTAPSRSTGDEPPTASLLGLQGLRAAPISRPAIPPGADTTPPTRSLLGLEGIRPSDLPPIYRRAPRLAEPTSPSFFGLAGVGPAPSAPQPPAEPASRSFFGLQALPYAPPRPSRGARAASAGELLEIEVPEFERDVEHRAEPAFPLERAILASLGAHALLLLLLLFTPSVIHDPRKGLLAALVPPEKSAEEKIPLVFREAPGPARPNPKKSDLSDADRRASGGDRSKPRSDSPFVPERQGKQGLQPGPRRPSAPALPPPGSAGRPSEASKGPAARSAEDAKRSETADPTQEALVLPKSGSNASGQSSGGTTAPTLPGLNQAIRDAARGVGAEGEDGAGFPNPGGGFVDSGPLSFDTTWYDWGPYAAEMIRRIKLHWGVPELARLGWKGKVTVRFYILADGRVDGATILSRSSVPPFDNAAFQAIVTSSPFRPLPKDLGSEREGVTVTFFYNMRPGESGSGSTN